MTIAEKIFAQHAVQDETKPGDLLFAKLDLVMGTDVTVPLSVKVFNEMGVEHVFDPHKIALINDHFVPAKDIKAAELSFTMRRFAREQGIKNYYEVGRSGVCHVVLPEEGLVAPGDLIIGADSHTCTYGALGAFSTGVGSTDMAVGWALGEIWFRVPATVKLVFTGQPNEWISGKDLILHALGDLGIDGATYKAIEFCGEVIDNLPMADRLTICNMAIEAGAKAGIIAADDTARAYLEGRTHRKGIYHQPDEGAEYSEIREYNVSKLEPQVALPHLPTNVKPVSQVERTKIDQVVLGSCTNGRIEDMRLAAQILAGKEVHPDVRLIIIPGSQRVYRQMIEEGLVTTFIDAGAVIGPPTCGPCIGGHMGILAAHEVGVYTTNRNFVGRNGHPTCRVFLAGPLVAAASALKGYICDPRTL